MQQGLPGQARGPGVPQDEGSRGSDRDTGRHSGGSRDLQAVWDERRAREQFASNTLASQDNVWRVLGPVLGGKQVGEIRPSHVEAALAKIKGPAAKSKARSVLVATFNYAISEGRRATNPATARRRSSTRAARLTDRRRSAENERRLDSDQLSRLIDAMPERYRALVELMARVGLRPGEAYALTVGQFDQAARTLTIDRTVDGAWTKTGEPRTIVLPAVVAKILADHIGDTTDPTALVFPNRDGGMLDRNSFRHVFQRASARANVNHGLTPNDLRHTAAAFAVAHKGTVYDVQRMLGHAKPSITLDVYGFLWEGSLERLARRLDQAIRAERRTGDSPTP